MKSNQPTEPTRGSDTQVSFDLKDVLTAEELEKFQAAAKAADAPNLTEHLLDLTLRRRPIAAA